LPTGTVTFLFTDLEGSTRLWEEHPEAMQGALARHDEILRDAVESMGGHVVNTTPGSKSRRCSTTRQPGSEFLSSTEPSPVSRRAPAWVESQPPPRGLGSRGLDSAPVRSPVDGLRDSRARTLRSRSMSMWFSRAQRSPASLTAQIDTPRVVRRRAYRTARGHLDRKFIRSSAENQARSNAGVAARPLSIASRDTRWEGGLDAPTRERDLRPVEGFDR
jgi:hypothetical protein